MRLSPRVASRHSWSPDTRLASTDDFASFDGQVSGSVAGVNDTPSPSPSLRADGDDAEDACEGEFLRDSHVTHTDL